MAISRNKVALAALAIGLLAAGLPALGQQQQTPESILPPGFGEPAPVTPAPSPTPGPATPAAPGGALPLPGSIAGGDDALDGNSTEPLAEEIDPRVLAQAEMPGFARRSLAITGIIDPQRGGMEPGAFGHADGHFLGVLMQRMDAPIPSRWLSIGLRRMLASRLATPAGANGADFAAVRAWLLVRMGEPIIARAVVQSVDNGNFTPKLYEAGLQAWLASGDPAGLCPVADAARAVSSDRSWVLAGAYCAGLAGDPDTAGQRIDAARRGGVANGIDYLLAEKVLGTGIAGRRAVTIEWDGVGQLTAWRYGLATATGVPIPDALYATVSPRVRLWQALAPGLDPLTRAPAANLAAAQGVLSSAALVDLYGAIGEGDDQTSPAAALAGDLRTAYTDQDAGTRVSMMARLWDGAQTPAERYARLILTARAATLVPVGTAGDSDRLIASMLSVGYETQALRWASAVPQGSDGWAMLQIVSPSARQLGPADVSAYQRRATDPSGRKSAMFFAAIAGLGRMPPANIADLGKTLDVDTTLNNSWTRAIDRAAAQNQPATVVLLAGIGMQTGDWRGVPPAALYRIVAAMHRVGLDQLARLIAVEAMTRL